MPSEASGREYVTVGQQRGFAAASSPTDDEGKRVTTTLHRVHALPDDAEIDRLADVYFAEQDKAVTSYVITRQAFEQERKRAQNDPGCRALVHAVYGVGILFLPAPDPAAITMHLTAAESLLQQCDTDRHTTLLHVRVQFLLVVGLGPIRGPHLTGTLHRAIFLAHVLGLHIEPDRRLPFSERLDRVKLFATLVKADWFSAMGVGRTFYMIQPDAEALPSLFGFMDGNDNQLGLEPGMRISLQMADLCRRIVDRERKPIHKWHAITDVLEKDVNALERQIGLSRSSSPNQSNDAGGPNPILVQMMFSMIRWTLFKPFYRHARLYDEQHHRHLHTACVANAIDDLDSLAALFTEMIDKGKENGGATSVGVMGVWFHVFLALRCALFVRRHIDLLDVDEKWQTDSDEKIRAREAIKKTREVLGAIAKHSVIAHDGLAALQQMPSRLDKSGAPSDPTPRKRKADAGNVDQQSMTHLAELRNTESQDACLNLDDLLVFKDDSSDGHFWDMIAWLEPSTTDV